MIKRLIGNGRLAREMRLNQADTAPKGFFFDSSFFAFGPSVWDGMEDSELYGLGPSGLGRPGVPRK
jgi:hypothetical protein